jgi:hypothetical protein
VEVIAVELPRQLTRYGWEISLWIVRLIFSLTFLLVGLVIAFVGSIAMGLAFFTAAASYVLFVALLYLQDPTKLDEHWGRMRRALSEEPTTHR